MPTHKPKNSNLYTWETSRANRGKPLPSVEIRSLHGGKQSTALLGDEIRSEQGKGENNQQIKDEDLLCVGASRREERGNQPTD